MKNDSKENDLFVREPLGYQSVEPKKVKLAERERCIKAVEAEEECPGNMPDDMWNVLKNDKGAVEFLIKETVRQTKTSIINRIKNVY